MYNPFIYNPLQKAVRLAVLLFLAGLFILNCRAATLPDQSTIPHIPANAEGTAELDSAQNAPPTLDKLATTFNFEWAKARVQDITDQKLEPLYYNQVCQMSIPVGSSNTQQFEETGFYTLISGAICQERAMLVASCLDKLLESKDICPADKNIHMLLDIIMLYTFLIHEENEDRQHPPIIPDSIPEYHTLFIEHFAKHILDWAPGPNELIWALEQTCLDQNTYTSCGGNRKNSHDLAVNQTTSFADAEYTIVQNQHCIDVLKRSPVINYIHPLNIALYVNGLKYIYDAETNIFVIVQHNQSTPGQPSTKHITQDNKCTIEAATRLINASIEDGYTIMACDKEAKTFKKILGQYRNLRDFKQIFKRDPTRHVKSFAEYDVLKAKRANEADEQQREFPPEYCYERRSIALTASIAIIALVEVIAITFYVAFSALDPIVPLLPFSLIGAGLASSILMLFHTSPLSNARAMHMKERHYACFVFQGAAAFVLGGTGVLNLVHCYHSPGQNDIFPYMLALYLSAALVIAACFVIRLCLGHKVRLLTRHVCTLLYISSFCLIVSVPLLCVGGYTLQARAFAQSQVLLVAAILFAAGAFLDVTGQWFDREVIDVMKERSMCARKVKAVKIAGIAIILIVVIGVSILTISRHNLLTPNASDLKL
ncbi:hypothetical protein NEHOM01_2337 [Nematocida homosporus]|uniref:uncharacterized protein n=1 Tax=Nematocida homosporus TaxID=1912981 RepID=UPI0022202FD8|nr:uncharacterized protein NEHOM01_2337 [Nematocida homosporus]KAI5187743.1 hypothetical protein NEHOM01_2337 [Nematocida homosporus]